MTTEELLTEIEAVLHQMEANAQQTIKAAGAASVFLYQLKKEIEVKGKEEVSSESIQ